ncbi:hypothetical protein CBL_21181, partial [Carabus blaptoides fortunei]
MEHERQENSEEEQRPKHENYEEIEEPVIAKIQRRSNRTKIKNPFLFGLDPKKLYNHRICIRHFEAEYINHNASKNQSCLKKGAIPTLLLGEGELNAELDFQKLYENYKTVPS